MTTLEVGTKLVELCRAGKNHEAMETLYGSDIVSVEAAAPPGREAETKGLAALAAKSKVWSELHEIHGHAVEGPYPHGDRFAVKFNYDITHKPTKERKQLDEVAVFTVANGKIVREEFFYRT